MIIEKYVQQVSKILPNILSELPSNKIDDAMLATIRKNNPGININKKKLDELITLRTRSNSLDALKNNPVLKGKIDPTDLTKNINDNKKALAKLQKEMNITNLLSSSILNDFVNKTTKKIVDKMKSTVDNILDEVAEFKKNPLTNPFVDPSSLVAGKQASNAAVKTQKNSLLLQAGKFIKLIPNKFKPIKLKSSLVRKFFSTKESIKNFFSYVGRRILYPPNLSTFGGLWNSKLIGKGKNMEFQLFSESKIGKALFGISIIGKNKAYKIKFPFIVKNELGKFTPGMKSITLFNMFKKPRNFASGFLAGLIPGMDFNLIRVQKAMIASQLSKSGLGKFTDKDKIKIIKKYALKNKLDARYLKFDDIFNNGFEFLFNNFSLRELSNFKHNYNKSVPPAKKIKNTSNEFDAGIITARLTALGFGSYLLLKDVKGNDQQSSNLQEQFTNTEPTKSTETTELTESTDDEINSLIDQIDPSLLNDQEFRFYNSLVVNLTFDDTNLNNILNTLEEQKQTYIKNKKDNNEDISEFLDTTSLNIYKTPLNLLELLEIPKNDMKNIKFMKSYYDKLNEKQKLYFDNLSKKQQSLYILDSIGYQFDSKTNQIKKKKKKKKTNNTMLIVIISTSVVLLFVLIFLFTR
jgi:hypothetical protein